MRDRPGDRYPHQNVPTPVAGTVLLIAVTVVVASITVVLLLDVGEEVQRDVPVATFDFAYDASATGVDDFGADGEGYDGLLTITHTGGSTIDASALVVVGTASAERRQNWAASDEYGPGDEVDAGSSLRVRVRRTDRVRLVWLDEHAEVSALLGQWDGPGE